MKINTTINRYVFLELIPPFLVNLVFFSFIFLMTQILEITNLVVNYGISPWSVILLLFYTLPFFLQFIIPLSVMMAVLLTFLRLSKDNEITAMKSGGVSLYGLVPPVLLFCLTAGFVTAFMSLYGLPKGRLAFKDLAIKVVASNLDIGLKERTFNDRFDGITLYVNKMDIRTKTLIDVFIEDQRSEEIINTVTAPKAKLISDPENFIFRLMLLNGTINQVDLDKRAANTIHFDTYEMSLNLKQTMTKHRAEGPKDEEEMTLFELREYVKNRKERDDKYYLALMEFYKKFSIPSACFALGILALPLGIHSKTANRTFGIGLGLAFFLLYYILLSAGWVFGEAGVYPPLIGMWVPNIVMGSIGVYMLIRTARERPTKLELILTLYHRIRSRFGLSDST